MPIGVEASFKGIIDLLQEKAIGFADELGTMPVQEEIPVEYRDQAQEQREALVEKIVETSDELMFKYLEGQEISVPELKAALRKATITTRLVPVLCGSALRNKGIQSLLDAVVDYLPSPLDIPPIKGINPRTGAAETRMASDEAPFSALAFKIVADPFVGRLAYFRVYSGRADSGSQVLNSAKDRKERFGRLLQMHANHREDVSEVFAGDIAAAVGLKNTFTGDTLCDPSRPVLLEAIKFPEPVISVAIEPKTKADQDRMGDALSRLAEEDPTFRIRSDPDTGQTIISGMGELHLEVIVDRMTREYRVQANVGKPQVAYKETVSTTAEAEGRFIRQTGGKGQYGHVVLRIEPLPAGHGFEIVNQIAGGVIPKEFIPAAEAGVREAIDSGVLAGYPVVDLRVTLLDGSYHEVDSSEIAFKIAGSMAVKNAMEKASPVLLEPIMKVEVVTPDEFLGDVVGDLIARRGHVAGIEPRGTSQVIRCSVPLAEMFGYATDLRSMTQGRATYSMEFDHYQEVPKQLADSIIARTTGF
jgi:elongation factor G